MADLVGIADAAQTPKNQVELETEREGLGSDNTLGQDTFFKLLITQLRNQDPLNPMEDSEFVSQMAEFSALEKNEKIYNLLEDKLNPNQLLSNANLIGREITADINGIEKRGVVNSVKSIDNKVYAVLDDESEINIDDITAVNQVKKEV
ncbi:MAG: flagellar hook capping FlgD N-terminal domain-containing protein [Halanaerobiales bacterium]|nr:flagellar hook capping FlgD N-terminal domain-containing protein [Halanaerobiales bacterium]